MMKQYRTRAIAVVAILVLAAGSVAAQQATTVEGTLVDAKCYLGDNTLTGNDHGAMKGCGTMCLKGGSTAGIVTKDKRFNALVAPAAVLADYVGQTVRVNGTLHNGSILAKKVEVNKGGSWQEIKLPAM
ncbi:MAG: hypothetical protein A3G76_15645 [Acidobacteria bacterium RIFCSPLOWO2_12_FULL_65_11]|nr:MAG: hypothetical protein A3H95_17380 [Acidobacteria bacterium RIFCSPLOWO2_02_FULL_64_15]OFW30698.1 MAG: hypothetical protein A3G76_15645 [Acidobacteria bacterium RIFCSPLOWO2_12_FULL_65_11]